MANAAGTRMGGVFVEIGADSRQFFAAVNAVDARLKKLGSFGIGSGIAGLSGVFKSLNDISKGIASTGRALSGFGTQLSVAGAAVAAPIGLAVRQFATFDDAIRATAAVTGLLGADGATALKSLTDKARDLGATTSYTATEVANLMTELGRAGFNPSEINAMTDAVLNLARATGTNATTSAGIMSAALRQFGLGAGEAARVADVLTETANQTFTSVEGLGESLKYAGPVAKSLGMSLEDTSAILGVLGNVGIQGSEAGTALRRLGVISAGAGEKLRDLFGVSNVDAAGNMKPLVQILDEINTATKDMPVGERTAKMAKAFGLLGITSANVLSQTSGGVLTLSDRLKQANGIAATTARAMDAGVGGSMRLAKSAINDVAIEIGNALAPSLQVALAFIRDLANGISGFVRDNQTLVISVAQGSLAVVGAGAAFYGLGAAVTFAGGIIGAILSPLGLLAAGIAALVVSTPELSTAVSATFGEVSSIVGTAMTGMYDAITGGDLGGAMQIAMESLKAAWLAGTADIQASFASWSASFLNGFTDLGIGIAVAWEHFKSQAQQTENWWNFSLSNAKRAEMNGAIQAETDRKVIAMEAEGRKIVSERTGGAANFANDLRGRADASKAKLLDMTSVARDRRILSAQGDDVIKAVADAKSLDDIRTLAQEFFALRDTGMLTDAQQKKYGEAVDMASERLTPTSGGAVAGITATVPEVAPPNQDALMSAVQSSVQKSEVAGTFSSVGLGSLGYGSTLAQQQLEVLKGIKANTDDIGDEGAVAA